MLYCRNSDRDAGLPWIKVLSKGRKRKYRRKADARIAWVWEARKGKGFDRWMQVELRLSRSVTHLDVLAGVVAS